MSGLKHIHRRRVLERAAVIDGIPVRSGLSAGAAPSRARRGFVQGGGGGGWARRSRGGRPIFAFSERRGASGSDSRPGFCLPDFQGSLRAPAREEQGNAGRAAAYTSIFTAASPCSTPATEARRRVNKPRIKPPTPVYSSEGLRKQREIPARRRRCPVRPPCENLPSGPWGAARPFRWGDRRPCTRDFELWMHERSASFSFWATACLNV